MSTAFSFQAQLVSIMDALSKTAVMEISKLVEIESKMLKIEITRGRNEIASLTEKLQLMEKLLYMAQGGRRREAAATCSMMRHGSEMGLLEPGRTRTGTKCALHPSESQFEGSSAEISRLHRGKDHTSNEEQLELITVKEEPLEVDHENNEQERISENRGEAATITESQRSPKIIQHLKSIPEHQQPPFHESSVTLSSQTSLSEPGRRETHWNLELTSANLEVGKSAAQNVTSQSLSVPRNVKLHTLRSSGVKRFGCLQCGKSFRCFSQLEIHQRSHTGEKPFRCTLCGKRYAQKGHLYTHQRTHTGEKPYRCPICGKGFIQKCTLDMHQRTHTGEKPFVCTKCGKGFTKNCNLKKHLTIHPVYSHEPSASTFSGPFVN